MKIVFMGTPDFAAVSLKKLIEKKYEILAVVSQPDKKKGRGHKVLYTPVKELALKNNLEVFAPDTFKGKDNEWVLKLKELNPDVIIVVAFGQILPLSVLSIPKYGCINVHGSLLPKYRGAGPIQWSILNGETVTGVTTQYMAKGVDTGDILLKKEILIEENETASMLYDKLACLGADVLIETLEKLENNEIKPIPQDNSLATHAPMLTKELCNIDFSHDAKKIHNQIRGLSEWPCASVNLQGKKLKVYKSEFIKLNDEYANYFAGTLINNKEFIVKCGHDAIKFTIVQYDTGKRMSGKDFLNGKKLNIGDKIE